MSVRISMRSALGPWSRLNLPLDSDRQTYIVDAVSIGMSSKPNILSAYYQEMCCVPWKMPPGEGSDSVIYGGELLTGSQRVTSKDRTNERKLPLVRIKRFINASLYICPRKPHTLE